MKYVQVEWNNDWHGYWTDPREYLKHLSAFEGQLPSGAREFATAAGHYDFSSEQCVKDLELTGLEFPVDQVGCIVASFAPNEWKHPLGLRIQYSGVADLSIETADHGETGYGTVLLDEILPTSDGCTHEIHLTGAVIKVRCLDLSVRWEGVPDSE